jgi:hypothetical protein
MTERVAPPVKVVDPLASAFSRLFTAEAPRWPWILLSGLVAFARKPDALLHPQFWAEDALIFHAQAEASGWSSLFIPNAGYLHVVPRLIALFANRCLPALYHPATYNTAAFLILLSVVGNLVSARWRTPLTGFFAVAAVLVPQTGEVLLTVTNLQWITALLLLSIALKDPPKHRSSMIFETVTVVLAGLTGPFSAILAPIYWLRYAVERASARLPAAIAITAVGAIQLGFILTAGRENLPPAVDHSWWEIIGIRLYAQTFLPTSWCPASSHARIAICVFGLSATIAAVAAHGPRRLLRAGLGLSALLLVVAVGVRMNSIRDVLLAIEDGSRYFYIVRVLLAWILISLVCEKTGFTRAISLLALAGMLAATAGTFRSAPLIDYHWENYAKAVDAGTPADIPVNPDWTYHYAGRTRPP